MMTTFRIEPDGAIVLMWSDRFGSGESPLYRCVCGKNHITGVWTSTRPTHCPCGEPFPRGEFFQWRAA